MHFEDLFLFFFAVAPNLDAHQGRPRAGVVECGSIKNPSMKTNLFPARLRAALFLLLAAGGASATMLHAQEAAASAKPGAILAADLPIETAVLVAPPAVPPPIGRRHPTK